MVRDNTLHDYVHAVCQGGIVVRFEYLSVDSREKLVDSFVGLGSTYVFARDAIIMEKVVQLMAGATAILDNITRTSLLLYLERN
jgi:hypothetical protein